MNTLKFPQVLLLGNGLNRAYNGDGWSDLLERIKSNQKVDLNGNAFKSLPYPLQAVLVTEDKMDTAIKGNHDLFLGAETMDQLKAPIHSLLDIDFDYILTTNYSYEIERAASDKVQRDGKYCKRLMKNIGPNGPRAESKYLLHTYNEVPYNGKVHKIWHIHGEARKPQSIILGHYYYGNLLGKCQEDLRNRHNQQYERQRDGKPPILESWMDVFIMGDVYVLGFGFDFSEMDMWWMLNRKKRERAAHGSLFFYEPTAEKSKIKQMLLESYGAHIKNMGFEEKPADYKSFYKASIADIASRVKENVKHG